NTLGWLPGFAGWGEWLQEQRVPVAAGASIALNLVGWLAAWPVWVASDVLRPGSFGHGVAGFFWDTRRMLGQPGARAILLIMGGFRGFVAAMTGVFIGPAVSRDLGNITEESVQDLLRIGLWIGAGVGLGSLLAGVQGHPRRALGLVPLGTTGLLLGLL